MTVIHLSHEAEVKLTAWAIATKGLEFSGLGLVERVDKDFLIVDVDLLGVGSWGYTEFDAEKQRTLAPDPRRKLWFHRHPIGSGVPGPSNWSGRDNQTAEREPLGGIPQLVGWSLSIVRTPGGWVGRADFYVPKLQTFHLEVVQNLPTPEILAEANDLLTSDLYCQVEVLLQQYNEIMNTRRSSGRTDDREHVSHWRNEEGYEVEDFDLFDEDLYEEEIEGLDEQDEEIWPFLREENKPVKPWWRLF